MDAAALLGCLAAAGVRLSLNQNGGITASGDQAAIGRYREEIHRHKPALLAALARTSPQAASEADHAHGEYVRAMIHAGWCWCSGASWIPPGA